MGGLASGETLPATDNDIDISRVEFETVADPAAHFGGDQARAGAEKRIILFPAVSSWQNRRIRADAMA